MKAGSIQYDCFGIHGIWIFGALHCSRHGSTYYILSKISSIRGYLVLLCHTSARYTDGYCASKGVWIKLMSGCVGCLPPGFALVRY